MPIVPPSAAARPNGRAADALRAVSLTRGAVPNAEGSCLIAFGNTRVLCAVSVEDGVPGWKKGKGEGWLTAEYAMLPGSGLPRKPRDGRTGRPIDGRSQEIQRLVGRALR
ncbi:MAG: ribonuclease PH, partial [Gemmatimonadota bacterium]